MRLSSKFRIPNQKIPFHSIEICHPLECTPDRCPILLGAQNMIFGTTIAGGSCLKIFDPAPSMPPAFKKAPKIYHLALHPLQKQWAFLAMNAGIERAMLSSWALLPHRRHGGETGLPIYGHNGIDAYSQNTQAILGTDMFETEGKKSSAIRVHGRAAGSHDIFTVYKYSNTDNHFLGIFRR